MFFCKRACKLILRPAREQRPHGFDRAQPHPRRRARREDAVDKLFPEPSVGAFAPNLAELREARLNLAPARAMRCAYLLDCYRLSVSRHVLGFFKGEVFGRKRKNFRCALSVVSKGSE